MLCESVCVTWAVAAQHPGLNEGSRDTDVVKETAVLTARLQPGTCDQHLYSTLRHTNGDLSHVSHSLCDRKTHRCTHTIMSCCHNLWVFVIVQACVYRECLCVILSHILIPSAAKTYLRDIVASFFVFYYVTLNW